MAAIFAFLALSRTVHEYRIVQKSDHNSPSLIGQLENSLRDVKCHNGKFTCALERFVANFSEMI